MHTLVIETATTACSVALIAGDAVVASLHEVVGRGHAERLVAMIAELPGGGRADAVLVDCGPGSFTGVRVGLAAAIGLGIGWDVPVSGYSSLSLLAAAGFARAPTRDRLAVVMEGGHGEVFMQAYSARPFAPLAALASLPPVAALARSEGMIRIGNGVRHLVALDPAVAVEDVLPVASDAVHLPPAMRALPARPIYGRAPDAKPAAPR